METREIVTLEELGTFSGEVLHSLSLCSHAQVITLQGDLGAGKTAFTQALARHLGIQDSVTSPTFVIMKSYPIAEHSFLKTLVHIDAYRIESEDEVRVLGVERLFSDPHTLVCIEWPERILNIIPEDAYRVSIALEGTTRIITYGN